MRFGLRYDSSPKGFEGVVGRNVRITIDLAGTTDCGPILDQLFATDAASLAPTLPDFWKPFFGVQIPRSSSTDVVKINDPIIGKKFNADAARVTRPILLRISEPEYNPEARAALISGTSTIAFVVDANGEPVELSISKPIGFGLDERAIESVRNYRFKPAMRDGKPVAVRLSVEVEFKMHR